MLFILFTLLFLVAGISAQPRRIRRLDPWDVINKTYLVPVVAPPGGCSDLVMPCDSYCPDTCYYPDVPCPYTYASICPQIAPNTL
ncbi:hypothetical protein CLU79DRAFT_838568 [Phycomyces nitens]|nr:hypothetical protein CLU79DRAFT_838568 [Phycomyces nitens]